MTSSRPVAPRGSESRAAPPGVRKTVLSDFRQGTLRRTLRRDLRELQEFYLDRDRRDHLQSMPPVKRWFLRQLWLLEQLILKLSPTRRLMFLLALVLFIGGAINIEGRRFSVDFHGSVFSFFLVLVILMLELKDKLLARQEIEVGRAVQAALLPDTHPTLPGWELWLFTRPANDVGGDLVD